MKIVFCYLNMSEAKKNNTLEFSLVFSQVGFSD